MDEAVQELRLAWARLREDVDCGLRRGTWYRVTRFTPSDIFLDLQNCPVAVPRRLLDLVVGLPTTWSVVPRPRDVTKCRGVSAVAWDERYLTEAQERGGSTPGGS